MSSSKVRRAIGIYCCVLRVVFVVFIVFYWSAIVAQVVVECLKSLRCRNTVKCSKEDQIEEKCWICYVYSNDESTGFTTFIVGEGR